MEINGECLVITNSDTNFPNNSAEECCFYCNERDVNKLKACELCKCVFYCSEDHKRIHFNDR